MNPGQNPRTEKRKTGENFRNVNKVWTSANEKNPQ